MNPVSSIASFVRRQRAALIGLTSSWWAAAANAQAPGAGTSSGTTANFSMVTSFLQAFTDFMTGPFGKGVVVISIIAAFVTWVFAPRDGIFGPILRVVVAGIAILNAATWVLQLGGGGGLAL